MKKNLLRSLFLLLFAAPLWVACSDDDAETTGKTVSCTAEFVSTTMPQTVPPEGALYRLTFKISPQPAKGEQILFVPWQFRITLGDAAGDAVKISDPRTEVLVRIPLNYSAEERAVRIEMASADETVSPPLWQTIAEAVQEPSLKVYNLTQFESTNVPQTVGCNGGTYEVRFRQVSETRAADPVFVEWQYRITVGGETSQPVTVTEPTERIEVAVPSNYTETPQKVVVEMADAGDEPFWTRIVNSQQAAGLMKVGDYYWAVGNVTLHDGRFGLTDKISDAGLFFRNGSIHGVPSEADTYAGTAYTPEPVQIGLGEIPYGLPDADPCRKVDPSLRTPSYAELFDLDYSVAGKRTLNGVPGYGFDGTDYFLPFCGTMDVTTGQITGGTSNGGYWGLGSDYEGGGVIYILTQVSPLLYYDLMRTGMAMVRCVRDTPLPAYVSHTPATAADNGQFDLTITTTPGGFDRYEVTLEADDGSLTRTEATKESPTVKLIVPKNDEPAEREWRIFVNRIPSGASFVQPGLKNYARYVSHMPASASYEAFTLTVVCESDLDVFPVKVTCSDESTQEQVASCSKDNPTALFDIPENRGDERSFSISVNGKDVGVRVVQEKCPQTNTYSVLWSAGYVTVENGQYVFAEPQERGLYFKWGSRHGIRFDGEVTSQTKYAGTVWGPDEQAIPEYTDIPYNQTDPCSLVAPAGTWRMPTAAEYEELIADGVKGQQTGVYKMWSDGVQEVYFGASGQISASTYKVMLPSNIGAWSSTPGTTAGRYSYLMFSTNTSTGKVNAGGSVPETAMMVRCVREK